MNRRGFFLIILLAVVARAAAAWGEPARVGRVSSIEGDVSFSAGNSGSTGPASLNYPLTASDRLSTGSASRAEAHVGSTAIRLASDSAMTFDALDDSAVRVRLEKGSLSIRVRRLDPDQRMEVDTRVASVVVSEPGLYRVDQRGGGDTAVTVRRGRVEISTEDGSLTAAAGQAAEIPHGNPSAWQISAAPPPDSWDEWVASRDHREDGLSATRYVSREMDGVEDLDEFGSWRVIAGFGPCWVPFVAAAGWAPYQLGHWAWIESWGWTWIDDAPWGFAPFHYGRWVFSTGVWAWAPGPIVARPAFRPAQVAWVGGMPDRNRPPDGQRIRWVPLRPHQPSMPVAAPAATFRVPPRPIAGVPMRPEPGYRAPVYRGPMYGGPVYRAPAYRAPRAPASPAGDDPGLRKWRHDRASREAP